MMEESNSQSTFNGEVSFTCEHIFLARTRFHIGSCESLSLMEVGSS